MPSSGILCSLLSQYVSAASNMIVELFVDGLRTRLFRNHAAFHVEVNVLNYIGLIVRCCSPKR
jgi:hypothetical protein